MIRGTEGSAVGRRRAALAMVELRVGELNNGSTTMSSDDVPSSSDEMCSEEDHQGAAYRAGVSAASATDGRILQ